jgi:hypothetical protein
VLFRLAEDDPIQDMRRNIICVIFPPLDQSIAANGRASLEANQLSPARSALRLWKTVDRESESEGQRGGGIFMCEARAALCMHAHEYVLWRAAYARTDLDSPT